jgi:hypothetical protein
MQGLKCSPRLKIANMLKTFSDGCLHLVLRIVTIS